MREGSGFRVFENRGLRRIFWPKRKEITREWRTLCNEKLNYPYCLSNIVRVMKSRRMRMTCDVARRGERRGVYRVWWGNLRAKEFLRDPGVDGRIILRWIFRKWYVGLWRVSSCLRIGTGDGHL